MEQECTDIKKDAHNAGDEHYRAMTSWITGGRSRALLNKAYPLAIRYRRQLNWLIECYEHARSTFASRGKVSTAMEYKVLVDKDIKILDQYDPAPVPAVEPTK